MDIGLGLATFSYFNISYESNLGFGITIKGLEELS